MPLYIYLEKNIDLFLMIRSSLLWMQSTPRTQLLSRSLKPLNKLQVSALVAVENWILPYTRKWLIVSSAPWRPALTVHRGKDATLVSRNSKVQSNVLAVSVCFVIVNSAWNCFKKSSNNWRSSITRSMNWWSSYVNEASGPSLNRTRIASSMPASLNLRLNLITTSPRSNKY